MSLPFECEINFVLFYSLLLHYYFIVNVKLSRYCENVVYMKIQLYILYEQFYAKEMTTSKYDRKIYKNI